jgi:hypothetical protein
MRWVGSIVLVGSLIAGLVGAVTAYSPPLSLADERLVGATLNAPAGVVRDEEGRSKPLAEKGAALTAPLLARLRAAGVERVRVKEFDLGRWTGGPLFGLGCAGLIVSSIVARKLRRAGAARSVGLAGESSEDAASVLVALGAELEALRQSLGGMAEESERLAAVLDRLGAVQRTHIPGFVGARSQLVSRLGLARFAQVAERFAGAERQINRAWSAAADGQEPEANACLDEARTRVAETRACLAKFGEDV